MLVRLYSGDDGQSHFEDLDLYAWPEEWAMNFESAEIRFRRRALGHHRTWHNESRPQYLVVLAGQLEVSIGDGSVRGFGPGDVLMAEDLTGQGHTTRTVSERPLVFVTMPIEGRESS
jgi:mannose-6-phosphate isomerase-like protein (cupin superfamily)